MHKNLKLCKFYCKHPWKHKLYKLTDYNVTPSGAFFSVCFESGGFSYLKSYQIYNLSYSNIYERKHITQRRNPNINEDQQYSNIPKYVWY